MMRPHATGPCRADLLDAERRWPDRLPWPLAFVAIVAMAILAWAVLLLAGWWLLK